MSGRIPALTTVLLACGLALPAAAQQVVPLTYAELESSSHPCAAPCRRFLHMRARTVTERGRTTRSEYMSTQLGGRELRFALHPSDNSTLYVDSDGDRDFSDERPVKSSGRRRGPMGIVYAFGPLPLPGGAAGGARPACRIEVYLRQRSPAYGLLYPAGYMSGRVTLAGNEHEVAVVDGNCDGRYDGVFRSSGGEHEADRLLIDLDDNRKFADVLRRLRRGHTVEGTYVAESLPLPRMFRAGDAYYRVEVAPDGSALQLGPGQPQFGQLDVACPAARLRLLSDCGVLRLTGSEGRWQLPAGDYAADSVELAWTDEGGTRWELPGAGVAGKLGGFRVSAGQVTTIKVGPPLILKAGPRSAGGGMVSIGLTVEGQAGEQYRAGVQKNGRTQDAPRFRIVDESGRVGVRDSFEYG